MGKLLLLVSIMAVVALSAAQERKECGEDERYSDCANQCIATCQNPNPKISLRTLANCETGCKCKDGYVRQNGLSSPCIFIHHCPNPPARCGKNKIFDSCANNPPPCPDSSGRLVVNYMNPLYCQPGCRCKDGYVRSQEPYQCVPGDRCARF